MRPLFIIGNKRSGTSQLVRMLNLHPRVFVSHESDIIWILYQFHHGQALGPHAWDSDRGLQITLATSGHLLRRDASPRENFFHVQESVMACGTPWLPAQLKTGLQWIGDKKPMQHTDPVLRTFVRAHFPDARFLHPVRHPFDVVASSDRFNQTVDGDFWLGLSAAEKLARWTFHEQQALQLREELPDRVHTLRYEDFCRHPERELSAIFEFLEVEPDPAALREAARQTRPPTRAVAAIPYATETERVASTYGYTLRSPGGLRAWARKTCRQAAKVLAG